MDKELQVENGHFTRIVNPLIEELIKIPFKGCELAVALFIVRKTYGFQKKQDEISLTQFQEGTKRSRQTIVTALKNLQLVNVLRLVQRGSMKGDGNIWAINKYVDTWKVVNTVRLVQRNKKASLTERLNLVKTARHTKETNKRNTKETVNEQSSKDISVFIDFFKELNPTYKVMYGRPNQRQACERLLKLRTVEEWGTVIKFIVARRSDRFCPRISTPIQLESKYGDLETYGMGLKEKIDEKKNKYKVAFS